jgi:hypothetical protein
VINILFNLIFDPLYFRKDGCGGWLVVGGWWLVVVGGWLVVGGWWFR